MFKIRIVTPDGVALQDEVTILNIVTPNGQMGILSNHISIVASLETSIISTDNGERKYYAIGDGTLQFKDNLATLLVDFCDSPYEIDEKRAKAAKERAEMRLNSNDVSINLDRAQKALKRANLRLKLKEYI